MCMFDYADSYTAFSSSTFHTARKSHQCGECGRDIMPGEKYRYASGKTDDEMWTAKMCSHCEVMAAWLRENCGGWLYSVVVEDFQEHAEGSLPMLRHIVGVRRRWRSFSDPARLMPVQAPPPKMDEHTDY